MHVKVQESIVFFVFEVEVIFNLLLTISSARLIVLGFGFLGISRWMSKLFERHVVHHTCISRGSKVVVFLG